MIGLLFIILATLLFPSYANAAEEKFFTINLLWSGINFIILVAGFVYLYKKFHAEKLFKTRKDKIEKLITEAMDLKQKAVTRHQEVTQQLDQFGKINKEIVDDMNARAEMEKKSIQEEGTHMIERLKKEGERIADAEVQKAKQTITDHLRSQLYELSKDYIEKSIDERDQRQVTDKFIRKIK